MSKSYMREVARSIPFDPTALPWNATSLDVQAAIEELRSQVITTPETTATTAAGTLTLISANKSTQFLTGTAAGFNIVLPDATTLYKGYQLQLVNASSQIINVKQNGGTQLLVLGQTSIGYLILQDNGTAAGTWVFWQAFLSVASGIVNYNLISSVPFTTASTTDVVITGFTITPTAGTYGVWFSASALQTTSPIVLNWTIYKAGVAVADSARSQQTSRSNQVLQQSTQSIINVDGSQALDVRVSTAAGSLTINARSLLLIRLGT